MNPQQADVVTDPVLPTRLSDGEEQRVAIAHADQRPRARAGRRATGKLDSITGSEIMQLILDLPEERGMTVMVATHDAVVASRCGRVVRLRDGRIVDDVKVRPREVDDDLLGEISRIAPS